MTSKRDTVGLRQTFRSGDNEAAVGRLIRKLSGKPFKGGQKTARVLMTTTDDFDHPAFVIECDGAVSTVAACMCYYDADHDPSWDRGDPVATNGGNA